MAGSQWCLANHFVLGTLLHGSCKPTPIDKGLKGSVPTYRNQKPKAFPKLLTPNS